jgi:PAS domain S-box-containing protein
MPSNGKLNKIPWHLIIVFLLLSIGIGASGYLYYKNQKIVIKKHMEEEISTIADLKADQILYWYKERMGDAKVVFENSIVISAIFDWLKNSQDLMLKQRILKWMRSLKENYDYDGVLLLDHKKTVRLSVPEGKTLDCSYIKNQVAEALRKNKIIMTDLHKSEPFNHIHIGIVIPLESLKGEKTSSIAALLLQVDPYQFFYPLIQSWPFPSRTSETLLVRREENEVVYLNELRHRKNTAMNLRFPISEEHLPAAMAIRGQEGIVEGLDYRGVPVLAAIRRIPDSPWFLIAKVDIEEIYAPIHERSRIVTILASLLIVGAGAILGLLWSRQRAQYSKKQYEAELKHQALLQRFDYLSKYANDIILLIDQDSKIVEANDRALSSYDYTHDELLQLNLKDLRPLELRITLDAQIKQIEQSNGLVYETFHQRKDGTTFPVEVSSRLIEVEGKKFYQSIIRNITDRKRAEEALRRERDKAQQYLDLAGVMFVTLNKEGEIILINRKGCQILGYEEKELLGRDWFDTCLPLEESDSVKKIFNKLMAGEMTPVEYYENPVVTRSGEKRIIAWHNTVLIDDKESIIGTLSSGEDITERKHSEELLRDSQAELSAIIQNIPVILLIEDRDRRVQKVNGAAIKFARRSVEEMIGLHSGEALRCLHSLDDPQGCGFGPFCESCKVRNTVLETFKTGRSHHRVEARLPFDLNGKKEEIHFLLSTVPLTISKEQMVLVCIEDITHLKHTEQVLQESEERFRQLFDEAPVGYHECDIEGRITQVNQTELNMLGYSAEEMIGRHVWEFIVEGASQEAFKAKIAGTLKPGQVFERTYRRKDGGLLPVLIEDRLLRDVEGRITGIRATIQDITEHKRTEEEKATLQEQLRQSQKMEAIGKLAGGIAHDFNNLLTIIKGYGQLSIADLHEGDPLRGNIEEIKNAADKAADLTHQLLAFSRRQILEMKVLDINIILRNLDKMLRRVIGEDIELITVLTEDLGRVKTDPGQIEQVIMNLAVNARDAMPDGGKLTIETANVELDETYAHNHVAVTPGRYVMFSMSDTGVGMTPEVKERVFEPFFTTKGMGRGTGLGLSTVYGIVKQSGGNIWVYSEPGKGATFKIYLPRVDEPLEELMERVELKELPRGDETVLVAEDDEEVRKLAIRILRRQGYTVLEGSHGNEAYNVCKQYTDPIHLLVTDVVMPGMSGHELAEKIASIRPEIRVLYMSGYTDNAIARHGILSEGMSYIQKPFTVEGLARKVREVLGK